MSAMNQEASRIAHGAGITYLALGLFVCAQQRADAQPPSDVDDSETIRSLTQELIDVSEAGDLDAYINLVTDDALWLGERGPTRSGHEAE